MDEKRVDLPLVLFDDLESANSLRQKLTSAERKLWVLVYKKADCYEVSIQNSNGNSVSEDVLKRCKEITDEFRSTLCQNSSRVPAELSLDPKKPTKVPEDQASTL